jgi:hypothetical protein
MVRTADVVSQVVRIEEFVIPIMCHGKKFKNFFQSRFHVVPFILVPP